MAKVEIRSLLGKWGCTAASEELCGAKEERIALAHFLHGGHDDLYNHPAPSHRQLHGAIFPKEVLEELHVSSGDTLHLIRTERGYELTPYDPDFEEARRAFDTIRRKHRNAFRELAE